MELLQTSIKEYLLHKFWDSWGYVQRRLAQDKLLAYIEALIHTDFSSVMSFGNKFEKTCSHPHSGTVLIATVQSNPEVSQLSPHNSCASDPRF
jgi:hypothetical protein